MTTRSWVVPEGADHAFQDLCREYPRLVTEVFWQRGLRTLAEVKEFIDPDYTQALHDPFLYRHMAPAVDRIIAAIASGEPITIYGDYDADGISATTIMVETIGALGGVVDWYLPERLSEGYGLNVPAVEALAVKGTKLLITVDCGSTNVDEISRAKHLGLDVIVLDHHQEPAVIPPADSIINPMFTNETFPFKHQASAGVALTVARGLLQRTNQGKKTNHELPAGWVTQLLDVAAIATVTDMMPLRGENRAVVKQGLIALRSTRRPGLRALLEIIGQPLDQASEFTIGWQIGPRLNAAGRLHHPALALELLLTKDQTRARQLAEELQALNTDRQKLTQLAVTEAFEQISAQGEQSAYTAFASHWSPGILGLVAGRLAERVSRPVLVMTANGDEVIGSGRSIPGFDIMTVMNAGHQHFRRFGGHAAACGFTLIEAERRLEFQTWWQETVAAKASSVVPAQPLYLDAVADLPDVTPATLDLLDQLGPYGIEHKRPTFLMTGVKVIDVNVVGANHDHLRIFGQQGGQRQKFIGFRLGAMAPSLSPGTNVDLAVEASWNVWQGRKERQMKIIDIRPTPL